MTQNIHFILTGGTIDSAYDPKTETAQPNEESVIPPYIANVIQPYTIISHETICMKDSADLTDEDRENILKAVKAAEEDKIIIAHGTITMENTAEFLLEELPRNHHKTIVLTGAMIPLKEFAQSDAGFNLGYAISEVKLLESGIYICMHGHTFAAGLVTKNMKTARFETQAA